MNALEVRKDALAGTHVVPHESPIRDVVGRIEPAALSQTIAAWLADRPQHTDGPPPETAGERENRRISQGTAIATAPAVPAVLADGKRLAGARRPDGTRVNLLSVTDHDTGHTLGQHEIAAKTDEIPELADLLTGIDLRGKLLTVGALHTQRDTASLRNLVIGAFPAKGHANIAHARNRTANRYEGRACPARG